jgi:hypothetical protein
MLHQIDLKHIKKPSYTNVENTLCKIYLDSRALKKRHFHVFLRKNTCEKSNIHNVF